MLGWSCLRLLIDPVELGALPADNITLGEPEGNLLLGVLDAVRTVADIPANINGIVAAYRAGSGGKGVGGTKDGYIWRRDRRLSMGKDAQSV